MSTEAGGESSLKEILIMRKRKENLTRLYNRGKLRFREHKYPDETKCTDCGTVAAEMMMDGALTRIPVHLLDMDDMQLCEPCFRRRFYVYPENGPPLEVANPTNPHLSLPLSEGRYDGFYGPLGEDS